MTASSLSPSRSLQIALVGNPNCGKTTLFNAFTGLRHKVGNYAGVTVEKKEGRLTLPGGEEASLIDLPGLYSLTPHSPDEQIAQEVLLGLRTDTLPPDIVLNVVDASNLERNLYLTTQLLDLGVPVVVALTMTDLLKKFGQKADAETLSRRLGVPVLIVNAAKREGLDSALARLAAAIETTPPQVDWALPELAELSVLRVADALKSRFPLTDRAAYSAALTCLMKSEDGTSLPDEQVTSLVEAERKKLTQAGIDFSHLLIEARYRRIAELSEGIVGKGEPASLPRKSKVESKLDRIVLHPVFGYLIFFVLMSLMFQSVFTLSKTPMEWIQNGIAWLGARVTAPLPSGDLKSLIQDGVFGGVGSAIVFIPQIVLIFFFVSLLEDTGYMARAAFLMDRLMSRVGLHGKSFIPLLSAFGCAIPAVMATRTIGDRKARLITILVAPLMSCSARLPVYALMIGAFIPSIPVLKLGRWSLLTLPGVTMISLYFLGMAAAFTAAFVFHRTLLKGVAPTFLMEMPPYRPPVWKSVFYQMGERALQFLQRAATVILAISMVLWFLKTYPKSPELPPDRQIAQSYAGQAGHLMEPILSPLGFDWKIGVGIVASFAAREVFVSTMGVVYNVEDGEEGGQKSLQERMRSDINPKTGRPVFTPLSAVCVMVFFVLAMQCSSTVVVVRRETGSWGWAAFQFAYMTGLAWTVTLIVYQAGSHLGWGTG